MKLTIILVACIICYNSSSKDTTIVSKYGFGIKGGLQTSSLGGEFRERQTEKFSYNFGLFLTYDINSYFSMLYGIDYVKNRMAEKGTNYKDYWDYELVYLNFPILLCFNPFFNFRIHSGVYLGYMLNGNIDYEENTIFYDQMGNEVGHNKISGSKDVDDIANKLDFGYVYGLSYLTSEGNLYSFSLYVGLRDIFHKGEKKGRVNQRASLSVGYRF